MSEEKKIINVNENADSIEIGTSRLGKIKVYGNFRNEEDFISIEFPLTNDYFQYRLNSSFIFRMKSQLFFGLNSWKDVNEVDHHLLDALLFDYTLSQGLFFNPLNKQSVIFGIGLFESVQYIYSRDFSFQFGLLFSLGFKL